MSNSEDSWTTVTGSKPRRFPSTQGATSSVFSNYKRGVYSTKQDERSSKTKSSFLPSAAAAPSTNDVRDFPTLGSVSKRSAWKPEQTFANLMKGHAQNDEKHAQLKTIVDAAHKNEHIIIIPGFRSKKNVYKPSYDEGADGSHVEDDDCTNETDHSSSHLVTEDGFEVVSRVKAPLRRAPSVIDEDGFEVVRRVKVPLRRAPSVIEDSIPEFNNQEEDEEESHTPRYY